MVRRSAAAALRSAVVALVLMSLTLAEARGSTPVTAGYLDFNFGTTVVSTPTGEKPESKLWWTAEPGGRYIWWGYLWSPAAAAYRIHRLDLATQSWVDTGVAVDARFNSKGDVLWDDAIQKLYVVSHVYAGTGQAVTNSSQWGRLYRYTYDNRPGAASPYVLDAGFPVNVTKGKSETLVIAKDSTGKLWVTYVEGNNVLVNRSLGGSDTTWGEPFVLPAASAQGLNSDDIATIVAFQGNKIGVMWSNQNKKKIYFAVHADGAADGDWQPEQTALPGPRNCNDGENCADDHINLKSLASDGSGRVFAAIKTSLSANNAPAIMLLVRDFAGSWDNHVFGRKTDNHTRPIVLLDEANGRLYMLAAADGSIYMKESDINNITFPPGRGTLFISSASDSAINDPTSTKQNLNGGTGLLVLAGDKNTRNYFHNYLALAAPPPNNPPLAVNDSASTPAGTAVEIAVLGNDSDPDGDPLTVTSVTQPAGGSAVINANGTVTFTPNAEFTGTTAFNYTISDGRGGSASATVSVTVVGSTMTLTFVPTDDAYVKSSNLTSNYGTSSALQVRSGSPQYVTYLKFTVTGVVGAPSQAKLRLFVTDPSPDGGSVFAAENTYPGTTTPWTQAGITWSKAPTRAGTALADAGAVATGTWVEINVLPAVTGNGIYSFALVSGSTNSAIYSSKEGANPPQLVVTTP